MPNFKSDALGNGTKLIEPNQQSFRVRKLTAKECWRLMGFEDQDFENARQAMNENIYHGKDKSGSQLYKQAGNSIVVDVLLHIMENLYNAMPYLFEDMQIGSFFSGIGAFEKALTMLSEKEMVEHAEDPGSYPELTQIGYINDYNGDANRIYDCTVARVLKAEAGGGGAKTGWYRIGNPNTAANTQKCESVSCNHFKDGIIIDDTMGFEAEPRTYEGICPSLRASRQGLKTVGIVDPQGRTQKKCTIQETCPTLRAETHGNPPCAVLS